MNGIRDWKKVLNDTHRIKTVILGSCNDNISISFQNYFKYLFDRELLFYCDRGYIDFKENDCIFLMEPIEIKGEWYSIFSLWLDYFKTSELNLKTVIFYYNKKETLDSNPFFISLNDNKQSFYKKINSVLSFSNLSIGDHDFYPDTALITDVLKVFFKGHGEESLVKLLTDLAQLFMQGPQLVAMGDYTIEECVQELIAKRAIPRWKKFKERYNRYLAYFMYTPFFKEIQGLTDYFQKVDAYLQNIPKTKEAFIKTTISEEIRKARVILEEIDRKYIGSERTIQL